MKATGITCTAILASLFGVAVHTACLPRRENEKKDLAKYEQSEGTQRQSHQ